MKNKLKCNGKLVTVNGHKIHVYVQGNKNAPTILFMSGHCTVSPVYDFKVLYEKLLPNFKIIVIVIVLSIILNIVGYVINNSCFSIALATLITNIINTIWIYTLFKETFALQMFDYLMKTYDFPKDIKQWLHEKYEYDEDLIQYYRKYCFLSVIYSPSDNCQSFPT